MMSKRRVHYELPGGDWTTKHDGRRNEGPAGLYGIAAQTAARAKRQRRQVRNLQTLRVYT